MMQRADLPAAFFLRHCIATRSKFPGSELARDGIETGSINSFFTLFP
jgi:hypothetical protein